MKTFTKHKSPTELLCSKYVSRLLARLVAVPFSIRGPRDVATAQLYRGKKKHTTDGNVSQRIGIINYHSKKYLYSSAVLGWICTISTCNSQKADISDPHIGILQIWIDNIQTSTPPPPYQRGGSWRSRHQNSRCLGPKKHSHCQPPPETLQITRLNKAVHTFINVVETVITVSQANF